MNHRLAMSIDRFLSSSREWAIGRFWLPRAALVLYLVYAEVHFLLNPLSGTILAWVNFVVHELGHMVFGFAGQFIYMLMGSGVELLVPIVIIVLFLSQPDYFGVAVGGFWLSFSLFKVARYVGDARAMQLPLAGGGDHLQHDWHYLLSTVGLLPLDTILAFLMRVAATLIAAASLALSLWLLMAMARSRRAVA